MSGFWQLVGFFLFIVPALVWEWVKSWFTGDAGDESGGGT